MRILRIVTPPADVDTTRNLVERVSKLASGQVTSCVLDGPPLRAVIHVTVPDDRVERVQEVCGIVGLSVGS